MFLWVEERPHKQAVTATARVGRCFGVMRGACASVCPSCDKVPDKSNLRRASPGSLCEGTLHHKESTVAGWLVGGCGCESLLAAHNVTGQMAEGRIPTLSCLPPFYSDQDPSHGMVAVWSEWVWLPSPTSLETHPNSVEQTMTVAETLTHTRWADRPLVSK